MSDTTEHHGISAYVTSRLHRHKRRGLGLRMTPMIDVIFLLLTFFVLTAQFDSPEQALPLVFSADAATQRPPSPTLELSIEPHPDGCIVHIADESIEITEHMPAEGLAVLIAHLQATVADDDAGDPSIRLLCDDAVSWALVTKIYDVVYGLGARDITFVMDN